MSYPNANRSVMQPKHEEGISADDMEPVVMPNMVMFSGMLKSEVQQLPDFAKKFVVWPLLNSKGRKKPVLKLTARQFLWGYEDELACIKEDFASKSPTSELQSEGDDWFSDDDDFFGGNDFFEEHEEDGSFGEESAQPEEKPQFVAKPKYRKEHTGKCMFGVLAAKNGTWSQPVTARDGTGSIYDKAG